MNRRDLESLLLTLESTPALLARAAEGLTEEQVRRTPPGGGFSFIENVWHLADLEREGYGVRVRRILCEDEPYLADFDGDRIARERDYKRLDLAEGLAAFAIARNRNVRKLRSIHNSDWKRRGAPGQLRHDQPGRPPADDGRARSRAHLGGRRAAGPRRRGKRIPAVAPRVGRRLIKNCPRSRGS